MIKIIDLYKKFGDKEITRGLNLEIPEGKMTCIIGKSGEGKSVLLKQIIGLMKPDSGQIIFDGQDLAKLNETQMAEIFQKIGYVFQFAALLDSLNVFENVGITLLEEGEDKKSVMSLVKEKLALVNMQDDVVFKYPSELSGGMKKRVGLARTLMTHPKVILYDEPTTGLDPITTRIIHDLMYDMQKQMNITSVVITHDLEIFKYADKVALLNEGKIAYFGDAKDVWESKNPYIYQFIRGLSEGPIQTEVVHTSEKAGM
ncbi:MAG: ABC transporter, ATP-binding protein [candidate division TM6 bacterium GW2011_GWF2_32_72]|nr:MAG: ABC transporter, ATP-binding protein [candidate division TM6 bacterium GW2011_GWF2_32_72]